MADTLQLLSDGFGVALSPANIVYVLLGVLLGMLVGLLPGLGSTAGVALLIPLTLDLEPTTAIIMLAGVYYGSMYGGAVTAILINTPGEASNVMTTLDGYPMARNGRAGAALAIAAISSFVAGTVGVILLSVLAAPLSQIARAFGPAEYFCLVVFAMTAIASLMGKSILKGLISVLVGLVIATIGTDLQTGIPRYTGGAAELLTGVDFLVAAIGLFALGEVFSSLEEQIRGGSSMVRLSGRASLSRTEARRLAAPAARGGIIGFLVGVLPGAGGIIATVLAYSTEVRISGHRRKFGTGEVEGIAAPEAANSSSTAGTMVPLFTLGVPGSSTSAVLLGALLLFGVQPGPLIFQQEGELVWGVIASMYVGNVILLALSLPLVGLLARILYIPSGMLLPLVAVVSVVGAYSLNNRVSDLLILVLFGVVGWGARKLDIPLGPMVLGLVLGPIMETAFRQALVISQGDPSVFVASVPSIVLLSLAVVSVCLSFVRPKAKEAEPVDA